MDIIDEINKELGLDFSKVIEHLENFKSAGRENLINVDFLDFLIETLKSDSFKTTLEKYKNQYRKLQGLNMEALQIELILKALEKSDNNFVLPKSFNEYESNKLKYKQFTLLLDELKESFEETENKEVQYKKIYEQIKTVINIFKSQNIIKIQNDIVKLSYSVQDAKKHFVINNLSETFFKKLQEINKSIENKKTNKYRPLKFNIFDVVFLMLNKDVDYEEYERKYKSMDLTSRRCIFTILRKNNTLRNLYSVLSKLIFMSQDVLEIRNSAAFTINIVKEDFYSTLIITPIKCNTVKRSETEPDESKKLFLKNQNEKDIDVHHIIEFRFISKDRDISISKEDINKVINSMDLSKNVKKTLSNIKTLEGLIDNRYNLIPILSEVHKKEIHQKVKEDLIKAYSGAKPVLNLFTDLEIIEKEVEEKTKTGSIKKRNEEILCLKHKFTGELIELGSLSGPNSWFKKNNIQDLLDYNKALNKILGLDQFKSLFQKKYNKLIKYKNDKNEPGISFFKNF